MKLLYCILAFIIVQISCLSCKDKIAPVSTEDHSGKNRFAESIISLEKKECYEQCPSYTITIEGNGKVTYEGKKYVSKMGAYQKQLSAAETSKLFNAYECANFFDFQSEYINELKEDLPKTYLSFQHRGFKKKVTDQYEAPEELKSLEKMVEDIAESEVGWSKM